MSDFEKQLAASAPAASREAIEKAFAAGLSITVQRGNRIVVKVAPDGTETTLSRAVESGGRTGQGID